MDLKIFFILFVLLVYVCLENIIGIGESIFVKVEYINKDEKLLNLFYFCVGLINKRLLLNLVLDFFFFLCIKIEKDECLGDLFVCIFRRGYFYVCKDEFCIDIKVFFLGMDFKLFMYVCFEIFCV